MPSAPPFTQSTALISNPAFQKAKADLLAAIQEASRRVDGIVPAAADSAVREAYQKGLQEYVRCRGRDLYFPFLSSGIGHGPFVELEDGSVKYDMITAIGVNFFGHSHPEFIDEVIQGLSSDLMQGNLQPGVEAKELLKALLARVGEGCQLKHAWLTTCGTMANEVALKIVRQKKAPATKILAFQDCFAGRSTAMQEITDNPKYRDGQPVYGEVEYLPFFDPKLGLESSLKQTLARMQEHLTRYSGKFAALMIELVQGEGGFTHAPREFYERVFEMAKKAGLAVWIDEIQTFGRTGELFAYQKFGLNQYVDIVTVGKMLQACAVLYSTDYNPKPGLVAGTFSGSSFALRAGRRTLELLDEKGLLGEDGRISKLSKRFEDQLKKFASGPLKGLVSEIRVIGGMIAFAPLSGTPDDVKSVLMELYDQGVIAFSCGHGPYLVRLLPPLGCMEEHHVDEVCGLIEKAVKKVAERRAG